MRGGRGGRRRPFGVNGGGRRRGEGRVRAMWTHRLWVFSVLVGARLGTERGEDARRAPLCIRSCVFGAPAQIHFHTSSPATLA